MSHSAPRPRAHTDLATLSPALRRYAVFPPEVLETSGGAVAVTLFAPPDPPRADWLEEGINRAAAALPVAEEGCDA